MTVRIQTKCKRRFPLASGRRARTRRTARPDCGRDSYGRKLLDDRFDLDGFDDFGDAFRFRLVQLGGLVNVVLGFVLLGAVEALFDLGLLVMDRGLNRRQAGRMMCPGMLDDILAERIVSRIALGFRRLRRLEPHVIPAEVLEAVADLTEALRPHGRAGSTLAGEKSGRKRRERLGFSGHLATPY